MIQCHERGSGNAHQPFQLVFWGPEATKQATPFPLRMPCLARGQIALAWALSHGVLIQVITTEIATRWRAPRHHPRHPVPRRTRRPVACTARPCMDGCTANAVLPPPCTGILHRGADASQRLAERRHSNPGADGLVWSSKMTMTVLCMRAWRLAVEPRPRLCCVTRLFMRRTRSEEAAAADLPGELREGTKPLLRRVTRGRIKHASK